MGVAAQKKTCTSSLKKSVSRAFALTHHDSSDFSDRKTTLLDTPGQRTGLGRKLSNDSLNMIVSDYAMSNFPWLTKGWGETKRWHTG
jgi:hypothetical protein